MVEIAGLAVQIAIFLVLAVFVYALTRKTPTRDKAPIFQFPSIKKDPLQPHYMTDQQAYEKELEEQKEGQ